MGASIWFFALFLVFGFCTSRVWEGTSAPLHHHFTTLKDHNASEHDFLSCPPSWLIFVRNFWNDVMTILNGQNSWLFVGFCFWFFMFFTTIRICVEWAFSLVISGKSIDRSMMMTMTMMNKWFSWSWLIGTNGHSDGNNFWNEEDPREITNLKENTYWVNSHTQWWGYDAYDDICMKMFCFWLMRRTVLNESTERQRNLNK